MRGIIWGLLRDSIRNPWALLSMYALTIAFVFVLGNTDLSPAIRIPVYSEELSIAEVEEAVEDLNREQNLAFEVTTKEDIQGILDRQSAEAAVELDEESYSILVARDSFVIDFVDSLVQSFYTKKQFADVAVDRGLGEKEEILGEIHESESLFPASVKSFEGENSESWIYDQSLQSIFGFSLFFVIYTITFSISSIIEQKQNGVWDRLILSPASKTSIYLGNLTYSFLIGYLQIILVFLLFASLFHFDFQGGLLLSMIVVIPYVFALVSFGVFISGILTSTRQLGAIIPFIAVSMAMLGGAFWPIEIVSSKIILALSYISPITYGMDMLKGATLYNWSFEQFLFPASVLFFMGVIFMGIGLNLMERRSVQ
ncbi:ABC transporter permease [Alkalihalobacillus sp. FSL R5-0424]